MKPKIIMMVGLMGSGKSTRARVLSEMYNAVVLASDKIREEFPNACNDEVFRILYKRGNEFLADGKSIIIDATNTTIKARQSARRMLSKADADWIAYVTLLPYEECIERLTLREKPENLPRMLESLNRYYHNFQLPFKGEGFDEIVVYSPSTKVLSVGELSSYMSGYDQKTHWHVDTLDVHSQKVYEALKDYPEHVKTAGLYHDIAKYCTRTIDETGNAHYYGHANIGAYLLLLSGEVLYDAAVIVNHHMLPFSWETEKSRKKYLALFGETLYNEIMAVHEADLGTHEIVDDVTQMRHEEL